MVPKRGNKETGLGSSLGPKKNLRVRGVERNEYCT